MKRALFLLIAASLCAAPAEAVTPRPGPGDARINVVDYSPAEVVELRGALGLQLSVEFDPAERIENVAIGDSLGWQVTPNRRANVLFVKPMTRRPATNMTVITSLRRYNFRLSVAPSSTPGLPFVVRFLYPAPAVAMIAPPPPPLPPEVRNSAYSFQGARSLAPVRVFDDGQDTYFAFAADADLPAIFAVETDGAEAVVNMRKRDGLMVADRVAQGFVLRRGAEMTRIFNDGFRPQSASLLPEKRKDPWWRR